MEWIGWVPKLCMQGTWAGCEGFQFSRGPSPLFCGGTISMVSWGCLYSKGFFKAYVHQNKVIKQWCHKDHRLYLIDAFSELA